MFVLLEVKGGDSGVYLVVGVSAVSPPDDDNSDEESHHQSHTSEGDSDVHVLVLRHLHPPDWVGLQICMSLCVKGLPYVFTLTT